VPWAISIVRSAGLTEWHSQASHWSRHDAGNYFVPVSIRPIFIFCCRSYISNYLTTDGLKNFFSTSGGPLRFVLPHMPHGYSGTDRARCCLGTRTPCVSLVFIPISVLFFSRTRLEAWPHHGRTFSLVLSIQAVRGLPRLRAPGIVPYIISFSRHVLQARHATPLFLIWHDHSKLCFTVFTPTLLRTHSVPYVGSSLKLGRAEEGWAAIYYTMCRSLTYSALILSGGRGYRPGRRRRRCSTFAPSHDTCPP